MTGPRNPSITVCIATYRRPVRLAALLDDLVVQALPPTEVVVVDNDPAASARYVVDARRRSGAPFPLIYAIQPVQNISLTRNQTVALATGEWLAFIDDDERAPRGWLAALSGTARRHAADGALGPVLPDVPISAPAWIQRGSFYSWVRMPTGMRVPPIRLRFGNVLLNGKLLRGAAPPFDPAYGLTGGEDGDLLTRLVREGAVLVWCDEAEVQEPVEAARLSFRWLLLRSLRGGQDFARHTLRGRFGPRSPAGLAGFFLRALVQAGAALVLALLAAPRGRHRVAHWLLKCAANVGKLSVLLGWHYREYRSAAT